MVNRLPILMLRAPWPALTLTGRAVRVARPEVAAARRGASVARRGAIVADDNTLVTRARAGDEAAFQELVARYQRKVYGVAYGMLHSSEDAMDVTQEAFIRVHRYLDRFKGTSSFFTWLYRITVNLCIDHIRREGKAQTVDYDDSIDHSGEEGGYPAPPSLDMNPARAMDRKELREMITKALDTLSPNHRAVILMREVEGLSYKEMAAAMKCSKGTIMSRLFHARRRMADALRAAMEEKKKTAVA
jgi:RNA polymerase sigma-70 factor (ECF subfamily)